MKDIRRDYIRFKTILSHDYRLQVGVYIAAFLFTNLAYVLIFWHLYPIYEGKNISLVKSALFVAETITTVGYGELGPFRSDEIAILAILIMISGIIAFFGMINLLVTPMIQSRIKPVPPRHLPYSPEEHVVIFGYSQIVQEVIDNLKIIGATVVLIESDQEKALAFASSLAPDVLVIWGDYHDEEVWDAAHIKNAGYIILFLEERLSARLTLGMRSVTESEIIVVITDNSLEKYLMICGADQVVSAKDILGAITALHALLNIDPEILVNSDIMQDVITKTSTILGSCQVARVPIIRQSISVGKTIGDLQLQDRYQFRVFAVIDKGSPIILPTNDFIIRESMVLHLIGSNTNLFRMVMEQFITPHSAQLTAIIAGYGDMGVMIERDLKKLGISSITIDTDQGRNPTVTGAAEREEVLIKARICEAHFLLVVTNNDDINLFTTLMARELNPCITIFCRANDPDSVRWIYRSGADYVINVPSVIAQALGRLLLFESTQILLNMHDEYLLVVRYYNISEDSPISVEEITHHTGVNILAIDRNGEIIFPVIQETEILPGDAVYALGRHRQIEHFIQSL
jgi:Trk K+ transport system NAD-binding subunit